MPDSQAIERPSLAQNVELHLKRCPARAAIRQSAAASHACMRRHKQTRKMFFHFLAFHFTGGVAEQHPRPSPHFITRAFRVLAEI